MFMRTYQVLFWAQMKLATICGTNYPILFCVNAIKQFNIGLVNIRNNRNIFRLTPVIEIEKLL